MRSIIECIDHGVYGIDPEDCPLCPCCDMPMFLGERITLQTVDCGPINRDLLRIVHSDCVEGHEDGNDDDD